MLSSPSELRESVGGKRVRQGDGEQKMGKEGMPGGLGYGRKYAVHSSQLTCVALSVLSSHL